MPLSMTKDEIDHRPATEPSLVEIIELKWLLAGEGMHLHVERLTTDTDYARAALRRAEASANPALRETASRVRLKLGLNPP